MVVPTGTATPWREFPGYDSPSNGVVAYMRDGHETESADLLAEALRADGIVRTLGRAIPIAESATLERAHYGHVDESDDIDLCDEDGETASGEVVDHPLPCIVAIVDITES